MKIGWYRKKGKIGLLGGLLASLLLVFAIGWHAQHTKSVYLLKVLTHDLRANDYARYDKALEQIKKLSPEQKKVIRPALLALAENQLEISYKQSAALSKGKEGNRERLSRFISLLIASYPNDPQIRYLYEKNHFYQTEYFAQRIERFDALFENWPAMSTVALEQAILLRETLLKLLPHSALGQDRRLDYAFAKQIEIALSAEKKQQAQKLLQQAFEAFPSSPHLIDLKDKYLLSSKWSDKHYPALLSDEWLVSTEQHFPIVGGWLQNQPAIRQLQDRFATRYQEKARTMAENQRHYFALSLLEKARHFASNIPSIELAYELEKKRYDLFLIERHVEEEKIAKAGKEKILEALLEVSAIPQAQVLLARADAFSEQFVQLKAPTLIKDAYARLTAFSQMQQDYDANSGLLYASLGYSYERFVENNEDFLNSDTDFATASLSHQMTTIIKENSRQTYVAMPRTKNITIFPEKIACEPSIISPLELFFYGDNVLLAMVSLPISTENKSEMLANNQAKLQVSTPWNKNQKSATEMLGGKPVENLPRYKGNDPCGRAWYELGKYANTASCQDRVQGTGQPFDLVVKAFDSRSEKLVGVSKKPVSIGDYNRFCLLSDECKPQLGKVAQIKNKKEKKKTKGLDAGLDLSDVQETIEEYDHFCILSGNCSGLLGEQNNLPVIGLTQQEIMHYVKWLSKSTGKDYRLPSVEECRKLPGCELPVTVGNEIPPSQKIGFYVVREVK